MAVKLGNGNWAVKEDKLLAYNDNSGLFFNKEFDFSRGTSATYVAKDGLIKTAGIQPNEVINSDFSNGTNDWETEGNSSIAVGTYEGRSNVANINILNTSTSSRIRQPFNYVNGKKYKVTVNVFLVSGSFRIDSSDSFVSGDFVSTSTTGSWLTLSAEIDAISTGINHIWLRSLSEVSQFYVDSVSVQEIQTDTPRIDFTNDTKGHLLLEPSRTNLVTYSEDINEWAAAEVTLETGFTAPDGNSTAYKITDNSVSSTHRVFDATATTPSTGDFVYSLFLKSGTMTDAVLNVFSGGTRAVATVDLAAGTIVASGGGVNAEIIDYGNGWYRCLVGGTFNSTSTTIYMYMSNTKNAYVGNGDFIYMWGAQLESGDFSTSYIHTTGAASTRNADVCNNSGSAQDFNDSEGVLYVEALLKDTGTFKTAARITENDTSTSSGMWIYFRSDNKIQAVLRLSGVDQAYMQSSVQTANEYYKVAFKYKQNDFALWVNGTEVATDTSGNTFSAGTLSKVGFVLGASTNPFIGKTRNLQVFTEALTDEQLQKLTS